MEQHRIQHRPATLAAGPAPSESPSRRAGKCVPGEAGVGTGVPLLDAVRSNNILAVKSMVVDKGAFYSVLEE